MQEYKLNCSIVLELCCTLSYNMDAILHTYLCCFVMSFLLLYANSVQGMKAIQVGCIPVCS